MLQNCSGLDSLNVANQRVINAIVPRAVQYGISLNSSERAKKILEVSPLHRGYEDDRDATYSLSTLSEIAQENKHVDLTNVSPIERMFKENS